ncbi:MAG: hypothetical protein IT479_00860 [Xanthomonadales bacterium]|nr:hypothetical protein [Xanthomonadales bacterium]MCC6591799.1 hypothetical protein [Xanthomonadales bacterium]MCE7930212.1 hypothetical protein [Xanthomonadales bacterium PRO6]
MFATGLLWWTPVLGAAVQAWEVGDALALEEARRVSPGAVWAQQLDLAVERLAGTPDTLSLPLPDGRVLEAVRQRSLHRGAEDQTWIGTVRGEAHSQLLLTRVGEHVAGYLHLQEGSFEITPSRWGTLLLKLDSDRFPECAGGEPVAVAPTDAPALAPAGGTPVIDVLVVFSPGSTTQLGGQAQAQAFAQSAVDSANLSYNNSQINALMRLRGVRFTARADSGNSSTDLSWVRNDPEVATWRDEVGADLVGMISEFSNACGQGYLMGSPPSTSFAPSAYQVSARGCAVGNLSYAHEHGHNMGLQHDPANASGGSFAYARGHFVDGNYRTVMSYSTECTLGCTRRPYFSNPNVSFQGAASGVADQRDNARAANQTAPIAEQFRAEVELPVVFRNGFE